MRGMFKIFFNNLSVSKFISETTNCGIFADLSYLFEIIAGILFLKASIKYSFFKFKFLFQIKIVFFICIF